MTEKIFFSAKVAVVALFALALSATALRFYSLGEQSLWIDEGYTINAALSIAEEGVPVLPSGAVYSHSVLSSYLVALSMKVFAFDPFSPWSARVPAALFGCALVFVSYALAQRLFRDRLGSLLVAFIVSFSSLEIAWSRQARGIILVSFFVVSALWLFAKYLDSRKPSHAWASLGAIVLGALSHPVGFAFVPAHAALLLWGHFSQRGDRKGGFAALVGYTAISVALGLFAVEIFREGGLREFAYAARFLPFLFGDMLPFTVLASCGAAVGLALKEARRPTAAILALVSGSLIVATIGSGATQYRYLIPFLPLMAVLGIYGARQLLTFILKDRLLASFASALSVLAIFFSSLTFVPKSEYRLEFGSPQPDFKSTFRKIRELGAQGDLVISPYAQLHRVYLGEPGRWLLMSIGKKGDESKGVANGVDYYAGAPILYGVDSLRELVPTGHGFVVIDGMARYRLAQIVSYLESDPGISLVYHDSGESEDSKIWLYRF
ncbi:MAG: glycosyltransferase family 39 protein [Candidatus Taylorbacteria bacterium]|nr:glycosyltransferase family 39 protein [Candidatus Taylorbacteria bacterium]